MTGAERQQLRQAIDSEVRAKLARERAVARAVRRTAAEQFLLEALAHGPRVGVDVVDEARKQGILEYRLRRTLRKLGVVQTRDPELRAIMWSLAEAA